MQQSVDDNQTGSLHLRMKMVNIVFGYSYQEHFVWIAREFYTRTRNVLVADVETDILHARRK